MVKLTRKPTRKMALVVDAGTMVVSKRANSRTDNLTASAERFSKMEQYSKACGSKDGDMAKDRKSRKMVISALENGTITTISNEQLKLIIYERR